MKLIENRNYKNQLESINLIAADERIAFHIRVISDTEIDITSHDFVKVDGKVYDTALTISPVSAGEIVIGRPLYE